MMNTSTPRDTNQFVFSDVSKVNMRDFGAGLFDALRAGSVDTVHGGVCRDTYGRGEQFAHALFAQAAHDLGLEVSHDHLCNTFMTWPGADRARPAVMIGSHLDSVPAGGNFDGAAGVVSGLAIVDALQRQGVRLACDLVVMGIRAEESMWFGHSYVGSRGALGMLDATALQKTRFDSGMTLSEHLRAAGGDPDAVARGKASIDVSSLEAFFELHIEQAPSLAYQGDAVAIGTAIPGNVRYPQVHIQGEYGHVGLPKRFRRDAAVAGARLLSSLNDLWIDHESRGVPVAITVGEFCTDAARHGLTIVPGDFRFSLDLRAYDEAVLASLESTFLDLVQQVGRACNVDIHLGIRASAPVAPADPLLSDLLRASALQLGQHCPDLLSPASHDSAAFHQAGVPYGFVFVRNPNGSHHPDEAMDLDDWVIGTAILCDAIAQRWSA